MEILKQRDFGNYTILVVRTEHQKEEIIKKEQKSDDLSSVAWAKRADNEKNAEYSAKNITYKTSAGNINFGIAITKSKKY